MPDPTETTYDPSQVIHPVTLAARIQELAEARDSVVPLEYQHLVIDLDDCALDSSPRTVELLRRFLRGPDFRNQPHAATALAAAERLLQEGRVPYLARDLWAAVTGDPEGRYAENWFQFWSEHFFLNESLMHDQPRPGVVRWLQETTRHFPRVAYLTGRHVPNRDSRFPAGMQMGTLASLFSHWFPLGEVLMKPQWDRDDVGYKEREFRRMVGEGQMNPLVYIDNEPSCVLAHHWVMTYAGRPHLSVWLEGVHSKPKALPTEVLILKGFE